ncbi:hypothetical protein C7212DRAFT_316773, partial [Tuber magnatum]
VTLVPVHSHLQPTHPKSHESNPPPPTNHHHILFKHIRNSQPLLLPPFFHQRPNTLSRHEIYRFDPLSRIWFRLSIHNTSVDATGDASAHITLSI